MNIKRYFAPDMRRAINLVRTEHGPDAVILSSDTVEGGVEIIAAVDYDQGLVSRMLGQAENHSRKPARDDSAVDDHAVEPVSRTDTVAAATATEPRKAAMPEPPPVPVAATIPEPEPESVAKAEQAPEPTVEPEQTPEPAGEEDVPLVARELQSKPRLEIRSNELELRDLETSRELRAIQKELYALKGQMRERFAWSDLRSMSPERNWLMRRAEAFGLTPDLADMLAREVEHPDHEDRAWREMIFGLAKRLRVMREDPIDEGGIFAFVGPTGVGKTTTIAKLAARHCLRHGRESLALITTDSVRIGAHRQLDAFAAILGVPVRTADSGEKLASLLNELGNRRLVLIDTAGLAPRDTEIARSLARLQAVPEIKRILVLAANMQPGVMQDAVRAFGGNQIGGITLTKVDETNVLGAAISVLVETGLPAVWLTDGQRVPEDLKLARVAHLLKRATVSPDNETQAMVPAFMAAAIEEQGEKHARV